MDAATGAYKAVSADRYGEMRKIDHLFHLQKKANNAQDGQLTELERYMSHMRGQALPQSPPPEFVATMRNAMRKAASEGRQLILSNLQLDFTAVDIDRFFDGFEVETIAIAFDSITELPTGFANIDFHTPVDAQLAVQYLHGKDLKGKKVTLIFSSFYHPDHDVDVAGSHTKLAVSAHQRVDLNDKPMADVQGALVEVRSVRGSITETGSTKEQLGAPPDDIDTDLEEARSRAKNGQGNMKLHLQKLEAYMKMANQERSLFGLPPLRRLPGGRMVSIKK